MDRRTLRLILWAPLILFVGFVGLVAAGLSRPADPTIHSKMVGQPVPPFSLPEALPGKPPLGSAVLTRGGPHLVNIFASWCLPCAVEAPQIAALARAGVPIEGIAVRDRGEDLKVFLQRYGDPYDRIGGDENSRVQMSFGSSGVPETFLVDDGGIIRAQYVGPLRPEDIPALLARMRALQ